MNDEWMTPQWILDLLPDIDLDPCYSEHSAVDARQTLNVRKGDDGLKAEWHAGHVFCNPPYTKTARWLAKAASEVDKGNATTVTCLVPAVPGDGPWKREVWPKATAIGFIQGRVAFWNPEQGEQIRGRGHALVVYGRMPDIGHSDRILWIYTRDVF